MNIEAEGALNEGALLPYVPVSILPYLWRLFSVATLSLEAESNE
jgi:hypothetical protein